MTMSEHIVPVRVYVSIFAALISLTLLTVGVAMIDLGRLNIVVALTIATLKALLVLLYFMHLRYSTRLPWLAVAGGFFWLAVLILLSMSDVLSRGLLGYPGT
jgi:cytochrome c oxidase subunit IV